MDRTYRRQKYTITFIPDTKKWRWDVTLVQTTKAGDEADTMNKAQKAAEKHIDRCLGPKD